MTSLYYFSHTIGCEKLNVWMCSLEIVYKPPKMTETHETIHRKLNGIRNSINARQAFPTNVNKLGNAGGTPQPPSKQSFLSRTRTTDEIVPTSRPIICIDPEGCTDADDAFNIISKDGIEYLLLHIADPTEYLDVDSPVFDNILAQGQTRYLVGSRPQHLYPQLILERASLILPADALGSQVKTAITIISTIENGIPTVVDIIQNQVMVARNSQLTYESAAQIVSRGTHGACDTQSVQLERGLEISRQMTASNAATEIVIHPKKWEWSVTHRGETVSFAKISQTAREFKTMIANFAKFANHELSKYLSTHADMSVFRSCTMSAQQHDELAKLETPAAQMKFIRGNSIRAEYTTDVAPHDIIGISTYTHFTSPLRRAVDTIGHILLKLVLTSTDPSPRIIALMRTMDGTLETLNTVASQMKKSQWDSDKWAHFKYIHALLETNRPVTIQYKCDTIAILAGKQLMNVVILNINDVDTQLIYTTETDCLNVAAMDCTVTHTLPITSMWVGWNLNQGTLPELDSCIKKFHT